MNLSRKSEEQLSFSARINGTLDADPSEMETGLRNLLDGFMEDMEQLVSLYKAGGLKVGKTLHVSGGDYGTRNNRKAPAGEEGGGA